MVLEWEVLERGVLEWGVLDSVILASGFQDVREGGALQFGVQDWVILGGPGLGESAEVGARHTKNVAWA